MQTQVKQDKGTADHLMPLGDFFLHKKHWYYIIPEHMSIPNTEVRFVSDTFSSPIALNPDRPEPRK